MRQLLKTMPLQLCAPPTQALAPRQELLQGCLTQLPQESGTCYQESLDCMSPDVNYWGVSTNTGMVTGL